ncbi:MAG TPA: nicotinate phosphoribosyltransferase [Actinomycetota bacterium]|jgi:nicotinate phosphoribosyltransferase|nr:nicotinate phosphoribosyltransferase [Actinomycetota bacterium]
MGGGLFTDLYELNMAASYLRRGMNRTATFSLFVRRLPPERGFLVAAGLEPCLEFLEGFGFEEEDLRYLREELGFDEPSLEAFRETRFDGEVWAVPEGRVLLADEPLLEITAPIAVAQLVETFLLNQISFQTAIASKAARCRLAARDRDVVDFAFRRTQGTDAAMAVARTTAIAGFTATSNVEAARRYGLTATGTMAHSYIEAFPTEAEAFRAFAQDFPGRAVFLVDTYDTANGVRTATRVIRDLGLTDRLGIRLDSGDLEQLSREARRILDDEGLPHVRIFASGGLDEHDVDRLVRAGAPIDAVGVGTRVGVSADAPYLDSVYKLVEYDGRPVLKLSEAKATEPGRKQVYRTAQRDLVALRDEPPPPGAEPLLVPVMLEGHRTGPPRNVETARRLFESDLVRLPGGATLIDRPEAPVAGFSESLERLTEESRARALRSAGLPG